MAVIAKQNSRHAPRRSPRPARRFLRASSSVARIIVVAVTLAATRQPRAGAVGDTVAGTIGSPGPVTRKDTGLTAMSGRFDVQHRAGDCGVRRLPRRALGGERPRHDLRRDRMEGVRCRDQRR